MIICHSFVVVGYPAMGHHIQFFLQIPEIFSYYIFIDFCSYQVHIVSYHAHYRIAEKVSFTDTWFLCCVATLPKFQSAWEASHHLPLMDN